VTFYPSFRWTTSPNRTTHLPFDAPTSGGGRTFRVQSSRSPFQWVPEPFLQSDARFVYMRFQDLPPACSPSTRPSPSCPISRRLPHLSMLPRRTFTHPTLNQPRAGTNSSSAGSTAPPAIDGHPTSTPIRGHRLPLPRNGRALVCQESSLPKVSHVAPPPFHSPFLTRSWRLFVCTHSCKQQHGLQGL
jgi:hypothetical protein